MVIFVVFWIFVDNKKHILRGGPRSWKHDSEITGDPKGPLQHYVSQLFGRVLRPQTLRCRLGGPALFPASKGQKNRNQKLSGITLISYQKSIDDSFRKKNSAQLGKKRMLEYGIIGILENFWPITWQNLNIFK